MTIISIDTFQNMKRILMENNFIRLTILPEVGGKMSSLVCKSTGQEFLSLSDRPFKRPIYGTNYEFYDISGFDECFPAIAEGFYPEWPWKGTHIPDHGELFSLPWDYQCEDNQLILTAYGIRFPYRFVKTISLKDQSVRITYELFNLSPYNFKYIWSAHPLYSVTPNTRIILPGTPNIRTDYSKDERFGKHLYETSWPESEQADGTRVDLSLIRSATEDAATKIFTTKLDEGWCALQYPDSSVILKMRFPVDRVPYVGIWINEGGWPFEGQRSFNVALEPCTGCPDKLETAIQRDEYSLIKGNDINTWSLDIAIE